MARERPSGITLSAVWFFIGGLENMGYGALLAFAISAVLSWAGIAEEMLGGTGTLSTLSTLYLILGFVLIIVGLGKLVVAWGILEGHPWARQWGIIAIAVALVGNVFIIVPILVVGVTSWGRFVMIYLITAGVPALIDILVLVYLLSEEARSYFGKWGETTYGAISSETGVATAAPPPTPTPAQGERTQLVQPPQETLGWLVATSGPHRGERFALRRETLVGRDPNICDVVLTDPTVSRQHAKIRLEGRHFYIYDMGSTAGTILNGHRVQRSQLMDNDRIRLGNTEFVVKVLTT